MRGTDGWIDGLKIASPCPESWDGMQGDDRKRFCGRCKLNVYNLSGMTRPEAEALVSGAKGRLCIRFFRREDGRVLTRDCPVGISALRRKVATLAGKAAALLALAFAGAGCSPGNTGPGRGSSIRPVMGSPVPPPRPPALMGEMAAPPPVPAPPRDPEMGDICPPKK